MKRRAIAFGIIIAAIFTIICKAYQILANVLFDRVLNYNILDILIIAIINSAIWVYIFFGVINKRKGD